MQYIKESGAAIAEMLEAAHDAIIAEWAARARADRRASETKALSEPMLIDHVPALLASVSAGLREPRTARPAAIDRGVHRGEAARAHAQARFEADYDIATVIREFGHLRGAILWQLYVQGVVLHPTSEQLLHAALDEALGAAAVELGRMQHEMLAAVVAQSAEGIVAVDENGRIRLFNDEAVRQHGATDQKVPPSCWADGNGLMKAVNETLPMNRTPLYRAMHGERVTEEHWQVRRPDGSVRELSGTATPLFHADGSPEGAVLIARDETDRLRYERGRELLARLSLVLARSLGGEQTVQQLLALVVPEFADYAMIDTLDAEGHFRRVGMAAARGSDSFLEVARLHVPSSAPTSPAAGVLSSRAPLIVASVTRDWLDALASDDREYRRLLEAIAPVSLLLLPLVVRDRAIGVLKLISSRADRRYDTHDLDVAMGLADRAALAIDNARAYQDAEQRAERLSHEAEWRERFMAMLSHDLRTPLSAIQLSADALGRDKQLPVSEAKAVARIRRATERVSRMVTDLLDFARARTGGGIPVNRRPTNLRRIAGTVIEELSKSWPERRIELSAPGGCSGKWDDDRIAQVVDNLVSNAIRYSPADTPVIVETGGRDANNVFLRVRNAGQPIPPDVAALLFEPFKRGTDDPMRRGEGLGLGLYIASEIARAHGGELTLEYSDARGTSFLMVLPREGPQDDASNPARTVGDGITFLT